MERKSPVKNLMADAFASDKGMVARAKKRFAPGGDVAQAGRTIAAVGGQRIKKVGDLMALKSERKASLERMQSLADKSSSVKLIQNKVFARDPEYTSCLAHGMENTARGLPYHLFLPAETALSPEDVFPNLRWGGRAIMVSPNKLLVDEIAQRFTRWEGFILEGAVQSVRTPILGVSIPGLGKPVHYVVARRVQLLKPGESTERFTYHVHLGRKNIEQEKYVVVKQVPTVDRVVSRLRSKFPDASLDDIRRRAMKFTEKIFPVFLTREAAMLKILQRDLPKPFCDRVPRCLGVEHDSKGLVRTLYMNWMRNGGEGLSQIDFAKQSCELLAVLHEKIGVIHLDLRLDNFVITENGVGFIDFGSAVRVGETFSDNSLLHTLFEEMMKTSQIQRMLYHMSENGLVTSDVLRSGLHKVDKAVDLFYLAVQMNKPHSNPDFKGLIHFNPKSLEARHLKRLTDEILRPPDENNIKYRTARDILTGLERVTQEIAAGREPEPLPAAAQEATDETVEERPHRTEHRAVRAVG